MKRYLGFSLLCASCAPFLAAVDSPWSGFNLPLESAWSWNEGLGHTYAINDNWYWSKEYGYLWTAPTFQHWIYRAREDDWIWQSPEAPSIYYSAADQSWEEFPHANNDYLALFRRIPATTAGYRIDPYLWRDFMPISGIDGSPEGLMANIRVYAPSAAADSLRVEKLWLYQQDETETRLWEVDTRTSSSPAVDEPRASGSYATQVIRHGPLWDVYSKVSIGALLRRPDGTQFLLHLSGTTIHATY